MDPTTDERLVTSLWLEAIVKVHRRWRLCVLAVLSLLLPSCIDATDGQDPVHPVRGQVLYQGKPLCEARVVFHPVNASQDDNKPRPTGQTDAEGRFHLHTYIGDDGAPIGEYRVAISIAQRPSETRDLRVNAIGKDTIKAPPDPIQFRYYYPEKSGLIAKVVAGDNVLSPFDLK